MSTLGMVATTILSLYVVVIAVIVLIPPKQHDPQRGVGIGCMMMAGAAIAVVLAVTVVADLYQVRWLVWIGFVAAIFPAISLTGAGIRHLILKARGIED